MGQSKPGKNRLGALGAHTRCHLAFSVTSALKASDFKLDSRFTPEAPPRPQARPGSRIRLEDPALPNPSKRSPTRAAGVCSSAGKEAAQRLFTSCTPCSARADLGPGHGAEETSGWLALSSGQKADLDNLDHRRAILLRVSHDQPFWLLLPCPLPSPSCSVSVCRSPDHLFFRYLRGMDHSNT